MRSWALGLIAKWTGETGATPMYVKISGYSILFIALNALVMGGIILGLKFALPAIEKAVLRRRQVKAAATAKEETNAVDEENSTNQPKD